jgi:hypothetical protein
MTSAEGRTVPVPTDDLVAQLAAQLGRASHSLVELDRHPFRLLFIGGSFLTLTLRDQASREILEPTIDMGSRRVVDVGELRERDRAAAEERTTLTPRVRNLLLRHPDLPAFTVVVVRSDGRSEQVTGDADRVLALADDPDVSRVDIVGDIEIPD